MNCLRVSALFLLGVLGTCAAFSDIYQVKSRSSLPAHMASLNFPGNNVPYAGQPIWKTTVSTEDVYARANSFVNSLGFVQSMGCYYGHFFKGDKLLFVNGPTTLTTIYFEKPDPANPGKFIPTTVSGFGFQIESQMMGSNSPGFAVMRAFSKTTNTWSSYFQCTANVSGVPSNGTAAFLGVGSTARDISAVQFNCQCGNSNAYGWWVVNEPNISISPAPSPAVAP